MVRVPRGAARRSPVGAASTGVPEADARAQRAPGRQATHGTPAGPAHVPARQGRAPGLVICAITGRTQVTALPGGGARG